MDKILIVYLKYDFDSEPFYQEETIMNLIKNDNIIFQSMNINKEIEDIKFEDFQKVIIFTKEQNFQEIKQLEIIRNQINLTIYALADNPDNSLNDSMIKSIYLMDNKDIIYNTISNIINLVFFNKIEESKLLFI